MPISQNLNLGFSGSRFAAALGAPGMANLLGGAPAPGPAPAPAPTAGGLLGAMGGGLPGAGGALGGLGGIGGVGGLGGGGFLGGLAGGIVPRPPAGQPVTAPPPAEVNPVLTTVHLDPSLLFPLRPLPLQLVNKTTTQLAQGAIAQLSGAAPPVVREAMNTVTNTPNVTAKSLMTHLERFVRVGEVLNELSVRWSETTRGDFAKAFNNMDVAKTDVMDAVVSLAILNDDDLTQELLAENTPQTTEGDLQNRKVVWQSPPAGTPLQPPYVVLIAVEWSDVAKAQDIVKQITDQLVERDGFKMPRAAADKL